MSNLVEIEDIVAASDIAKAFGVVPAAVSNWQKRHDDFPKPFMMVAQGSTPLFKMSEIVSWYKARMSPELIAALLRDQ